MIKILLLADYSKESERRLLRGLVNYANENGGCIFHQMSSFPLESRGHSDEIIAAARSMEVDAVFGIWTDPSRKSIDAIGKPVIIRTIDKEYPFLPMLSGKYLEIGTMAADFYLRQHYTSLAFIGFKGILWSEGRRQGFASRCLKSGVKSQYFLVSDLMKDRAKIVRWLGSLPKPAGIFACNDAMARVVSEVCQFQGISVPDDVAILGADDDAFLCNITYPRLSSINLDFEKQGYLLGEAIFRMIREGRMFPARIPIEPTGISERDSTLRHGTRDKYVLEALRYMDEHFKEPININCVIADIPLSRRAIEMRFNRQMAPMTMAAYLNGLRVEHMCHLLRTTDLSVGAAASASGLPDSSNVGRVFRKVTGKSPSEYRELEKDSKKD